MKRFEVKIYEGNKSVDEVLNSLGCPVNCEVRDITSSALRELYEVLNPEKKDAIDEEEFRAYLRSINQATYGNWIYYDWLNMLVKIPPKQDYQLLRTARNQMLITVEEQQELLKKSILIAGMSVGSNVLQQLLHTGVGGVFVIADMDVLEITNLNRVKSGIPDISLPKVIAAARKALELDPYIEVYIEEEGVGQDQLNTIFEVIIPDIIVDEVDDIYVKILLRQTAKRLLKPLVMATDNSDGAILDLERYDLDGGQKFFNGLIPDGILDLMSVGKLSREEMGKAIGKHFVGIDLIDQRLQESLKAVRVKIPSWPQLGTAASISGVLVAYYCRRILLDGESVKSGRFVEDFDKKISRIVNSGKA